MQKLLLVPALLCAGLTGCAITPAVQSDILGRHHTVTAASIQEGRDYAGEYCRRRDQHARVRSETVVDRGSRQTYVMAFSCDGHNPNVYSAG